MARYPHNRPGAYSVWPGPNSNSFVAYVLAAIPEAGIVLPPTAIGKDWRADARLRARASGTGLQLIARRLLRHHRCLGRRLEVNVLGLVTGLDIRRPAIKLPGFGRIGIGDRLRVSPPADRPLVPRRTNVSKNPAAKPPTWAM